MASLITYLVLAIGVMGALTLTLGAPWTAESVSVTVSLVGALVYLALKVEGARRRLQELGRLQDAYEQLDQQA